MGAKKKQKQARKKDRPQPQAVEKRFFRALDQYLDHLLYTNGPGAVYEFTGHGWRLAIMPETVRIEYGIDPA